MIATNVLQRNLMKSLFFLFVNTSDGLESMSRDCGHLDMFIKIVFVEIRTIALQESMKDSYSHLGTAVL